VRVPCLCVYMRVCVCACVRVCMCACVRACIVHESTSAHSPRSVSGFDAERAALQATLDDKTRMMGRYREAIERLKRDVTAGATAASTGAAPAATGAAASTPGGAFAVGPRFAPPLLHPVAFWRETGLLALVRSVRSLPGIFPVFRQGCCCARLPAASLNPFPASRTLCLPAAKHPLAAAATHESCAHSA
jgi:hypothetical protein